MSEISIVAETRRTAGSGPAKRLRAAGQIPGVVYGHGIDPVSVAVDRRELRQALSGPAGVNAVINLDVAGTSHPTVVKSLQRHPVRRSVVHIDFLVVDLNEEITVDVPIVLEGEAKAVLSEGGLVEHQLVSLSVSTTPANIPNELTIDVSDLQIGDSVRVEDIKLPAGVTTSIDPETPIVTGVITRAAASEEEEAAEGEEGEGEAGEGGEEGGRSAEASESGDRE
jgi:large subunit ribosomal protein L25